MQRDESDHIEAGGYDVAVIGAGAAGVSAAIGAADAGARVLLLEATSYAGGAATIRTVTTYCGLWTCNDKPVRAVTGVADEVLQGLHALGGVSDPMHGPAHGNLPALQVVATDPESVKFVMDTLLRKHGVDFLLSTQLTGLQMGPDGAHLVAIAFGGATVTATARTVVDTSGDATATKLAGAGTIRVPGHQRQTSTMSARFGGIPADADVSVPTIGAAVRAAQASGVDDLTSSTGFSVRIPISHDLVAYLADEDGDPLDPKQLTSATRHAREQAHRYLDVIRSLPDCGGAYLVATGPELGIRESRHLRSRRPLRDEDFLAGTVDDDTVALCGWPSEYHPGVGKPSVWQPVGGSGAFGIALDSLRSEGTPALFGAGRVLTGDHLSGTAVRVMGTSFATGQAAGVAAALRAKGVADADLTAQTRTELTRQGATLSV